MKLVQDPQVLLFLNQLGNYDASVQQVVDATSEEEREFLRKTDSNLGYVFSMHIGSVVDRLIQASEGVSDIIADARGVIHTGTYRFSGVSTHIDSRYVRVQDASGSHELARFGRLLRIGTQPTVIDFSLNSSQKVVRKKTGEKRLAARTTSLSDLFGSKNIAYALIVGAIDSLQSHHEHLVQRGGYLLPWSYSRDDLKEELARRT